MDFVFSYPVLIALVVFLILYVVFRDIMRYRARINERKQVQQNIKATKKRSDLLFEEMKKNKEKFESTMFNIKKLSEQLKQQAKDVNKNKNPKSDSDQPKS